MSGYIALVGATGKKNYAGAAYVFYQSAGVWHQWARLTASDGAAGDSFGYSVALSGGTALVGAPHKNNNTGAAYAFVPSGASWSQQGELLAADGAAGDTFGTSVALSGNLALVGPSARAAAPGRRTSSCANTGGAASIVVYPGPVAQASPADMPKA